MSRGRTLSTSLVRIAVTVAVVLACGVAWLGSSAAGGLGVGTPPDPSRVPMPVGDIPGWHQVFADNFPQDVPIGMFPVAVHKMWFSYRDGLKDTSKRGTEAPSQVITETGGLLNFHLHTVGRVHLVGAALPIITGAQGRLGGLLYGRYVLRMRGDAVRGYKFSVLLWPDNNAWPRDGEIDFPEADLVGRPIHGFVHYEHGRSRNDQVGFVTKALPKGWHTTILTWLPNRITFQIDGRVVGVVRKRIPNTPMHMVIQAETRTTAGVPRPPNSAAGNVQVDWVSIYTPACNPAMSITRVLAACHS